MLVQDLEAWFALPAVPAASTLLPPTTSQGPDPPSRPLSVLRLLLFPGWSKLNIIK